MTTALASISTSYDIVEGWDPTQGYLTYYTNPASPTLNDLSTLQPLQGYWIHISDGQSRTWQPS